MNKPYVVPVGPVDSARVGLVVRMVGLAYGLDAEAVLKGPRAGPRACHARRTAMYLAHVGYGWAVERTAHGFGVNRNTAGAACRWAEDGRDDPVYDDLLTRHETALRALDDARLEDGTVALPETLA